jgi:broad specificity phosphatase PhoE
MPPTKVMIIRHAEKPMPGKAGVDKDGEQDGEALIVRGWQRAGALARFFAPRDGHFQAPGIGRPQTIYAPRVETKSESRRPKQTVEPLAKLIGIDISDEFRKGRESELVADVLGRDGIVLISWEHKAIAGIVEGIGGRDIVPPVWAEDRFDMVLVLDRINGGWTLSQVPQMLLAGDRDDPLS